MRVRALLVVDHGSRRAEANEQLEALAKKLESRVAPGTIVEIAHLEIAAPTIAEGFARCVERGATHVVVFPFMLTPGRHATEDIPRLASEAATAHAGVTFEVTEPLGIDDGVVGAVLSRSHFPPKS
jgi:sirohydrochlorin ferrochelatase